VNGGEFKPRILSHSEYVLALHDPQDHVAVLLRNRSRKQTLQRIATAETVAAPEFQQWLARQNRSGADVFIGMNPLKDGASNRTKDSLKTIRHLYVDLDEEARTSLAIIRTSPDVPSPNFILDTSPAKHQVVWKIDGTDLELAESLLRSLAAQFGGDPAATDATRVLRMPGFVNCKYVAELEFVVQARQESDRVHSPQDFTIEEDASEIARGSDNNLPARRRSPKGHKSQSELDWAFACRALARGDDPQEIVRRIADYRADDKPDPLYYARLTVIKAQIARFQPTARSANSQQTEGVRPLHPK